MKYVRTIVRVIAHIGESFRFLAHETQMRRPSIFSLIPDLSPEETQWQGDDPHAVEILKSAGRAL